MAYDEKFQTYAPGIQLLEALIDEAPKLGYDRIDLGVGLEGYKRHYATEPLDVMSGVVTTRGFPAWISRGYDALEQWGQKSLSDAPGRLRRRYSQIAACDTSLTGRSKAMLDAITSGSKK